MKISELIYRLQDVVYSHGDLDVWCFGMDKYGYAIYQEEPTLSINTEADLYVGKARKDYKICFIGGWE